MSGRAGENVSVVTVDDVAQAIRIADGDHTMGAAALAEVAIKALRSLPVEQRMEAMGMVALEVVDDDGETLDVWFERGDETDGGY